MPSQVLYVGSESWMLEKMDTCSARYVSKMILVAMKFIFSLINV